MQHYRLTLVFAFSAVTFTAIAMVIPVNRILIAGLFLGLLVFVALADSNIQRARRRETALVQAQLAERTKLRGELAAQDRALEAANREIESMSFALASDLRSSLAEMEIAGNVLEEQWGEGPDSSIKAQLDRLAERL